MACFWRLFCNSYFKSLEELSHPPPQVLEERSQLHAAWQHKKVYLDQLIDLHFFLRDAKQLDTISSSQEAYLSTADFGNTIEQVDAQVLNTTSTHCYVVFCMTLFITIVLNFCQCLCSLSSIKTLMNFSIIMTVSASIMINTFANANISTSIKAFSVLEKLPDSPVDWILQIYMKSNQLEKEIQHICVYLYLICVSLNQLMKYSPSCSRTKKYGKTS